MNIQFEINSKKNVWVEHKKKICLITDKIVDFSMLFVKRKKKKIASLIEIIYKNSNEIKKKQTNKSLRQPILSIKKGKIMEHSFFIRSKFVQFLINDLELKLTFGKQQQ